MKGGAPARSVDACVRQGVRDVEPNRRAPHRRACRSEAGRDDATARTDRCSELQRVDVAIIERERDARSRRALTRCVQILERQDIVALQQPASWLSNSAGVTAVPRANQQRVLASRSQTRWYIRTQGPLTSRLPGREAMRTPWRGVRARHIERSRAAFRSRARARGLQSPSVRRRLAARCTAAGS